MLWNMLNYPRMLISKLVLPNDVRMERLTNAVNYLVIPLSRCIVLAQDRVQDLDESIIAK